MHWYTFEEIGRGEVVDRGKVEEEVRMAEVEASDLQLRVAAQEKSTVVEQREEERMSGREEVIGPSSEVEEVSG